MDTLSNHRITAFIPIGQIVVDRLPLNPRTLKLISFLSNGGEVPAIHVQSRGNGKYLICDGRHRLLAMKLMGHRMIKARFSTKIDRRIN